jgi:hypothetical protein
MRGSGALSLLLLAGLALGACAAARRRAVLDLSEARVARATELRAEARAPAAFHQFERARGAAREAPVDSAERAERSSEARLWLEAAISQAERADLAERRLALERENVVLDESFLTQERERLAADDAAELRAAAGVARQEAEKALARAALAPAQRSKLSAAELERGARALLTRAELIALALPAGAAPAPGAEQLARLLQEARSQLGKSPDRALAAADRALFQALALLGALRAGEGAPDAAQKASLAEALAAIGARVVRDDRGLTASLPGALPPEGAGPSALRGLARLCALAQGYPRGPVQVVLDTRAAARKGALQKQLSDHGCAGERFSVAAADQAGATDLSFTWLAY